MGLRGQGVLLTLVLAMGPAFRWAGGVRGQARFKVCGQAHRRAGHPVCPADRLTACSSTGSLLVLGPALDVGLPGARRVRWVHAASRVGWGASGLLLGRWAPRGLIGSAKVCALLLVCHALNGGLLGGWVGCRGQAALVWVGFMGRASLVGMARRI